MCVQLSANPTHIGPSPLCLLTSPRTHGDPWRLFALGFHVFGGLSGGGVPTMVHRGSLSACGGDFLRIMVSFFLFLLSSSRPHPFTDWSSRIGPGRPTVSTAYCAFSCGNRWLMTAAAGAMGLWLLPCGGPARQVPPHGMAVVPWVLPFLLCVLSCSFLLIRLL